MAMMLEVEGKNRYENDSIGSFALFNVSISVGKF